MRNWNPLLVIACCQQLAGGLSQCLQARQELAGAHLASQSALRSSTPSLTAAGSCAHETGRLAEKPLSARLRRSQEPQLDHQPIKQQ